MRENEGAKTAQARRQSRREFLTEAGLMAAGLMVSGQMLARGQDRKITVGSGEHTYECLHDWLIPPDNILWGDTQGVAVDEHDNIYISHTVHPDSPKGDAILKFDKHGKFVTSWGERFRGGGHGLDLRKESGQEFLYHCDTAHRLFVKTTLDGAVIWEKGVPAEPGVYKDNAPFIPTNIAFGQGGDFYVADGYGSSWVHQYSLKGDWIRTFGGHGTELGKLNTPHGIWVDHRTNEPQIVIADRSNHRLQYFSLDGKPIRVITDGMRQPCHFSIRHDLMVIPDLNSVVTLVDKNNKVVALLGDGDPSDLRDHPRKDFIPGKFIHPHSAKFLRNGDILVVEWVPIGRITLLKKLA